MSFYTIVNAVDVKSLLSNEKNKVFSFVLGKSILERVLEVYEKSPLIDKIVLLIGENEANKAANIINEKGFLKVKKIIEGNRVKQANILLALEYFSEKNISQDDFVIMQNAFYPLINEDLIKKIIDGFQDADAACLGIRLKNFKIVDEDNNLVDKERKSVWKSQETEIAKFWTIMQAFQNAKEKKESVNDVSEAIKKNNGKVKIVLGSYENIKVNNDKDLKSCEEILMHKEADSTNKKIISI